MKTPYDIYGVADGTALAAKLAALAAGRGAAYPTPGPFTPPAQTAYINHDRWVIDCVRCAAGVACDPTFFSVKCWGWDRTLYSGIVYPADPLKSDVLTLLALRPDPETRNWVPGQTAADIAAENTAMGL